MRICHITINPIDYERRIINQAYTGKNLGYRIWIFALGKPDDKSIKRCKLYILRRLKTIFHAGGPLKFFIYNFKLFFHLIGKRFDLFHCHDLWVLPSVTLAVIMNKGVLIYDAHEYYAGLEIFNRAKMRKRIWLLIERLCMPHVNALITVSPELGELYRKRYKILKQIHIILNVPRYESTAYIQAQNILKKGEDFVIVFHGHFKPGRGLENLIQAIKIVPGVKLLLIGGGELEHKLRRMVKKEGLQERIIFRNYIPTQLLISASAQADIGVVLFEPTSINYKYALPNKFFEYLLAGLPILASNIETLQHYIKKYNVGITVDPSDVKSIAQGIVNMKSKKPQLQSWKENALRAVKELNWEKEEKKLINLYEKFKV
jgi:glycosyltransferase involved in cell wall biosynthesis